MNQQEIFNTISRALQETFEIAPERITMEAKLYEDLDIDSIDAVDLMVKLKSMTGQRLSPEAFRSVRTVGDVVEAIHKIVQGE
ncbi:MAG: acyl carrier protein [Moraxellaceae bacterium]|nr:acyl carrier protein [Moraxellaceae bacterium]